MKNTLLLTGLIVASCAAFGQTKPKAPILPKEIEESEKTSLAQSAYLLSESKFPEAAALLKPLARPAVAKVFVDWAPLPKALRATFRPAVLEALAVWGKTATGVTRFQGVDNEDLADVLVFFEKEVARINPGQSLPSCADPRMETDETSGRRILRLRVAYNAPYSEVPHTPLSIKHCVAQGLGVYLGLAAIGNDNTSVMGPDTHMPNLPVAPSASELERVASVQRAYTQLADWAQRKVAIYLPKPVMVVEKSDVDAGDVWRGTDAEFSFTLRNTGDAPLEIEAKPNCGCTVAKYDKVIAPGGQGTIQASMHTVSFRGRQMKRIDVKSNDPAKPQVALNLIANVKSILTILPQELSTIALKDSGVTEHEVQIEVNSPQPVEVTRAVATVPYVTTTVSKAPDAPGGAHRYNVKISVDEKAPVGRSAFMLTAYTTSLKEPQVSITVIGEKGIIAMPPTAYMGAIAANTVLPINQVITLSKKSGAFHLLKAESDDSRLSIRPETIKEGAEYRLMLTYRGGWPAGPVRCKLSIDTDDPIQKRIEIPVMATVLQPTAAIK